MRRPAISWRFAVAAAFCAGACVCAVTAIEAPAAGASTALVGKGQAGSFPWRLRITSRTINGRPGICVSFLWAFGPGQTAGNGVPTCYIPSRPVPTHGRPVWKFTLHLGLGGYNGVIPTATGGSSGLTGLRAVVLLVDARAKRAVTTLADGEVLRTRAIALPRRLRRHVRIAWSIHTVPLGRATGMGLKVTRSVAYNKHGHAVGSYQAPR